jgi:thiaminase/transcriptional activator TenA
LHVTLWEENLTQVQACSVHPFVQGLGDGPLDAEAFMGYVAQDAFFLGAFFSAYAPRAMDRTQEVGPSRSASPLRRSRASAALQSLIS